MGNGRPFTRDDDEKIIRLHEHGASWHTIGVTIKRATNVCAARYSRLIKAQKPIKSITEIDAEKYSPKERAVIDAGARLNDARLERDEFELFHGKVTAAFFGDPPPGFSALDRKRAGT